MYRKPIPSEPEDFSYSRQTSRFLSIWAVIFPFGALACARFSLSLTVKNARQCPAFCLPGECLVG